MAGPKDYSRLQVGLGDPADGGSNIPVDSITLDTLVRGACVNPNFMLPSAIRGSFIAYWPAGPITSLNNQSFAIDTLFAVPYIAVRSGTVDQIGFRVAIVGAAGSVARMGIYAADQQTGQPTGLMVDGGSQITDAGVGARTTATALTLFGLNLYWFVYVCGVAAPTIIGGAPAVQMWGSGSNNLNIMCGGGFTIAFPYANLPATFPSTTGASLITSATPIQFPGLFARYSVLLP